MARKPVGWQREPARHALAAKGIKTTSNIDELMAGWDGAKRVDRFMKTSLKPARERGSLIHHEVETDEVLTLELDDRPEKGSFYASFILRNEKTGEEIELGDHDMVNLCAEVWGYDATKNTQASHEEAIKASRFLQNKVGTDFNNFVIPRVEQPQQPYWPKYDSSNPAFKERVKWLKDSLGWVSHIDVDPATHHGYSQEFPTFYYKGKKVDAPQFRPVTEDEVAEHDKAWANYKKESADFEAHRKALTDTKYRDAAERAGERPRTLWDMVQPSSSKATDYYILPINDLKRIT